MIAPKSHNHQMQAWNTFALKPVGLREIMDEQLAHRIAESDAHAAASGAQSEEEGVQLEEEGVQLEEEGVQLEEEGVQLEDQYVLELTDDNKAELTDEHVAGLAQVGDPTATDEDFALAMVLQEMEDELVYQRPPRASGSEKVVVVRSSELYAQPSAREAVEREYLPAKHSGIWKLNDSRSKHKRPRGDLFRQDNGSLISKHDAVLNGRSNAVQLSRFHNAGELEEGFSVPNSVFNSLKQTLARSTIKGVSVAGGVGREYFARREGALDHATQLLLFNLQQSGVLESVGGVIRTGKEANVYRAVGGTVKDMPKDVVVKIQRPGTRDFANRHDYVEGDGRYRTTRLPHQGTRKALKLWTEKEFRNLLRANRAGLRVPAPLLHKQHCLLMEFVGSEDEPAPQLKEVELPESQWSVCYAQILAQMCMTFCRARLVHADLSEYNILYHNDAPVIIDWGQAVDLAHPDHIAYLTADAANIGHFFSARGVQTLDAHAIVRWVQNAAIKMEGDETSAAEMEQDLVQEVQELVNQLLASEIITTA